MLDFHAILPDLFFITAEIPACRGISTARMGAVLEERVNGFAALYMSLPDLTHGCPVTNCHVLVLRLDPAIGPEDPVLRR